MQLIDDYDPSVDEIKNHILDFTTNYNSCHITVPFKEFYIKISLGSTVRSKIEMDEIVILDKDKNNITSKLIEFKNPPVKVRPFGETLMAVFLIIKEYIKENEA